MGRDSVDPKFRLLVSKLCRVESAAEIVPIKRPNQPLIAVDQFLASNLGDERDPAFAGRVSDFHVTLTQIERVVSLRSQHERHVLSLRFKLARVLPLNIKFDPGLRPHHGPEAQPLQQPNIIRCDIVRVVEIEVVVAQFTANTLLNVKEQLAVVKAQRIVVTREFLLDGLALRFGHFRRMREHGGARQDRGCYYFVFTFHVRANSPWAVSWWNGTVSRYSSKRARNS